LFVPADDLIFIPSTLCFCGPVICEEYTHDHLLEWAISTDDGDRVAKIIQNALDLESEEVANYCFPRTWPRDREQRARIIGDWLRAEARYLA
jgi:hypothetical protein